MCYKIDKYFVYQDMVNKKINLLLHESSLFKGFPVR